MVGVRHVCMTSTSVAGRFRRRPAFKVGTDKGWPFHRSPPLGRLPLHLSFPMAVPTILLGGTMPQLNPEERLSYSRSVIDPLDWGLDGTAFEGELYA
eukprot:5292266-Amphidinium_carterae.1